MPLVDSSVVEEIAYDRNRAEMYVTFKSGTRYTYFAVPPAIYQDWLAAPSIGEYFSDYIRDRYGCARRN